MSTTRVAFVVLGLTTVHGFTAATSLRSLSVRWSTPPAMVARETTRREALAASVGFVAWTAAASNAGAEEESVAPPPPPLPPPPPKATTTKSGLVYEITKSAGRGGQSPKVGDLVAIRFKCSVRSNGAVIDNILESAEPYYYRVGSGQVVPAVEEAVVMMRSGDVWQLMVPPELGFGTKGRNSSPGKPRIAGDAILDFTLNLVAVPGKDEEILEENGILD